jgi:sugar phosphate isomerase/epimerase
MIKWGVTCFFRNRQHFSRVIGLAKKFPLQFLEIRGERPFFSPEDLSRHDLQFFRNTIEKAGLQVTLHATFYDINLSTINSYLKKANLQCYKTYLDLSQKIAAQTMVIHAGYMHYDAAGIKALWNLARSNLVENLKVLGDYAAAKNICLALENSPPNRNALMVYHWKQHKEILKQVNHPQVKAVLDVAHAHLQRLDISQYYRNIRSNLAELHIHNNNGQEDLHNSVEEGTIDYEAFFRINQVEVPVIMEIRNLSGALKSLKWIRKIES